MAKKPFSIRFDARQEKAIREISDHLGQSFSQTVRDLVNTAMMILAAAEKITLKDVLFRFSSEFAKTPYAMDWATEVAKEANEAKEAMKEKKRDETKQVARNFHKPIA